MKKPQSLRNHLLAAIPELQRDPERILIFVDHGAVRSTIANGLSFEYAYTLNMVLTDYAGDLAAVSIPVLDWVRVNQSDLMANLDKVKSGIKFEAEILANDKVDLGIELALTERVIVKNIDEGLTVSYPDEPQYHKAEDSKPVTLFDKDGTVLASWISREPEQEWFL
ncbi:phage tail protein [Acinetobacter ursingii]|uniref:phage tail protein n=1 Tax=Acinetobacter ursingii TaxID=108980 RepID=UPI00124FB164|nr:phage tail protein [Acinetobacter ursingii]MCU4482245.1 phage tail protein [Acinetobacter ursingii]MCU4506446.1 phage tail protein [Acinetobacter ursingii]